MPGENSHPLPEAWVIGEGSGQAQNSIVGASASETGVGRAVARGIADHLFQRTTL